VVCLTLGSLLLVALLLVRPFGFQPFNTPSGAMQPTLLIGDYFFVSKYAYGYSRYSLPFSLPLFSGRIFGARRATAMSWCTATRGTRRSITSNVLSGSRAIASR
jgi:signal peptidase I